MPRMRDRAGQVEHYRSKAEEVRIIAESMQDLEAKRILKDIAADYDRLANVLEHSDLPDPLPVSE